MNHMKASLEIQVGAFQLRATPKFSIESAFARLASTTHASATAFSSKLDRMFNKKTKVEQASAYVNGESAVLE